MLESGAARRLLIEFQVAIGHEAQYAFGERGEDESTMLYPCKRVCKALCAPQECENTCEGLPGFRMGVACNDTPSETPVAMTDGRDNTGSAANCTLTTMFCDIRGFSRIAEDFPPDALVLLLNEHFAAMTDTLVAYEGAMDKFFGDEFMAVFCSMASIEADAMRCVRAALTMQERNRELNRGRRQRGLPTFSLGIGINSGVAVAGYVGAPVFRELTVVGDTINTARRLCTIAMPGQILAGESTYILVAPHVRAKSIGSVALRGKSRVARPYEILGSSEEKMLVCG